MKMFFAIALVLVSMSVSLVEAKHADDICYDKMIKDTECMYEIGAFERGKYELATALSCFTKAQIYCHVADGKACFHIRGGAPRDFKCLDMPPACVSECSDEIPTVETTTESLENITSPSGEPSSQ